MKTILIADDEEDLRALLLMTLEDPAYRLVEASDGESALQLIQTEHPDVVILDWMMPKKNGIEVARAMQAHPQLSYIPIIMLTAKDQTDDQDQGQEAGVCAYLVKPFSPLQLLDLVQQLMGESSARFAG
ncbi:response regulator transcription factor [Candidatus Nitronereus thalassa]|uniref:Response regulator n=1 Tax=Candidatus Nitronereus thalassa TaxID=3020898 RepID=A0ABU3K6Q4_9BACT|nr:response regulator [Candidatus Nitronereus thalassa]MDT7042115.1 response regulator [Candidatus Nitronereus thalassa]